MIRTYGERWHGYQPAPRPPRHIEAEMEAAGRDGNQTRLDAAASAYDAWLVDQGWKRPQGRPARADEAAR